MSLADMDNETMARAMAEAIFSAALKDEDDDITNEQADRLYERCLAEAHLADEDYAQDGDMPGFLVPF